MIDDSFQILASLFLSPDLPAPPMLLGDNWDILSIWSRGLGGSWVVRDDGGIFLGNFVLSETPWMLVQKLNLT